VVLTGYVPTGSPVKLGRVLTEQRLYSVLLSMMTIAYAVAGWTRLHAGHHRPLPAERWFGFSQITHAYPHGLFILTAIPILWLACYKYRGAFDIGFRRLNQAFYASRLPALLVAMAAVAIFYGLRTRTINPDGRAFEQKFLQDVPRVGAHVTHDEMFELYVHSRFWAFTNRRFALTVGQSYAILSVVAGGVFVFVLLECGREILPGAGLLVFLLCMSGGYMQLFFGDVENYTLTAAVVTAYLLSSCWFINGKVSILVPSVLLSVGMMFHLEAGFLLGSLVYLWYLAWTRRQLRQVFSSILVFGLIILGTLTFFHFHGLPVQDIWTSHALRSVSNPRYWTVSAPSAGYYLEVTNLLFLLAPYVVLLIPLILFRRIQLTSTNVFLTIATTSLLLFCFFWRAQLGIRDDWNLFAIVGIPTGLLVSTNALRTVENRIVVFVISVLFCLHSYSWIVSNHYV
jgi:hypothetical protein